MKQEINLRITNDSLKAFCREVAVGSANTSRKHAAFMALEAFISRHAGADAHTHAYNAIQEIIEEFSNKSRTQLLTENAHALALALNRQQTNEIARIFSSVSRNGFKQLLIKAIDGVSVTQLSDTKRWLNEWCTSAKRQAEQASGYPDALDFSKIDIDLIEYTALTEINTLLTAY